ncbi:MAG TPA: diadenylate cyclase CdaA [Acetomicrobium flavidum]|uniref:Diadenylate cyclase n=2 Tax=Acetomicrobium TaxID=49894 RepID=I4BVK9_ACEMN|nr:diadenylate cyclase CdaA [Acetomicrobium mobile]SIN63625.1 diadenylate cyclase [Acetomicrobium flavidum]AFM21316.1 TIGR00159 family protein [Acetomicrobium mobile DSM 13181]HOJ81645.1 diadenylate cyclase CdaA [Acetomicrobium flavidum]HOM30687.1 diadenylate cyclase CdaA [Acetomicrobium flavidum]HOP87279.1 diadenylate cyclase CdaA [Acetomicrobium flavidum]
MIRFLSIRDILDILIIAFLIYRILLLLMDTRAMQLVKGLLLIGLVSVLARALHFEVLSWMLGKFLGVLFIAIPIVFQPELRRMLEEIGKGSLWRQTVSKEKAQSLADEVLRALMYLQSQRIGALLVLQRSTGLKDIWQSAVKLNAEISQEAIVSIFWPGNPLHDGAAILDRERIIAASCFLPLSDNPDISRWLGTRHRAALGITEVSDAISLVVSEERGEVSFAIRGHLSRGLKEAQLRQLLLHYFLSENEPASLLERIRRTLTSFRSGGVDDDEANR